MNDRLSERLGDLSFSTGLLFIIVIALSVAVLIGGSAAVDRAHQIEALQTQVHQLDIEVKVLGTVSALTIGKTDGR